MLATHPCRPAYRTRSRSSTLPLGAVAAVALVSATVWGQGPPRGTTPGDQAEAQAQTTAAASQITNYLNEIGLSQLTRRETTIAFVRTKDDAERRREAVRAKILDLVGGLPRLTGAPNVRRFATLADEGFTIENIAYQTVPGYWVTANVYVPAGPGPFPAIVIAPGHGAGKASQYAWGAYFARSGVLTLAIDPMGQGERMQHFDPELGASKLEASGDHEHANQTALLIGHHVARYWFADGIRGVDYLTGRADVIDARIGTFGCSGGGTAATYLMAMDPRVRVAAVASFITSFRTLLPGNGPQDAEQTLPSFIASELDFADWVEAAAPRPFAIIAFETDFFPVAGARATYDEARRFYSLYGAEGNLRYIEGGGGHCNLGPVTPQITEFLFAHLKGAGTSLPAFTQTRPKDADALTVTATGQVATSLGGRTAEDLTREAARTIAPANTRPPASSAELSRAKARIRDDARALAGIVASGGYEGPEVTTTPRQPLDGYRVDTVIIESEPGITLTGAIGIPDSPGPKPVVVWMDAAPRERTLANPEFARLVRSGRIVFAFHPRAVLGEPPPNPAPLALGPYMSLLLRATVVGKTIVGMRVDDTIRVVDWLISRPDVDRQSIVLYGTGAQGMVALHAAALDRRISQVVAEGTLVSYRMALEAGLHRNLSEVLVPGVLTRYDVPDLLLAIGPRPVSLVNPANAMGQRVSEPVARTALQPAFEADRALGWQDRIRIVRRSATDPLPLP